MDKKKLQLAVISLLFVGAIIGTYLVQQKTSFLPKAASRPVCNYSTVAMGTQVGYKPNTAIRAVAFIIQGNASTYIDDDYGGGAAGCSGEWNARICEAQEPGTYTWVHTWKHCVDTVNNCSDYCRKSVSYTISAPLPTATPTPTGVGPTNTPTPTPRPTNTPTPTPTPLPLATATPTLVPTKIPTPTPTPTPVALVATPTIAAARGCSICNSDIDGDNKITAVDFAIYRSCFGKRTSDVDGQGRSCAKSDIDGDGAINSMDLSCLVKNFAKYCR